MGHVVGSLNFRLLPDGKFYPPKGLRLIGIELRVVSPMGETEEVFMAGLDVVVPEEFHSRRDMSMQGTWNVTLHTARGDSTLVGGRLPV